MDAKQEIAQRLRGWLKENGLSQKEVADEIGVYATSLNKVALGESNFGVPTLVELAKKFDIDLNWLLTGDHVGVMIPRLDEPQSLMLEEKARIPHLKTGVTTYQGAANKEHEGFLFLLPRKPGQFFPGAGDGGSYVVDTHPEACDISKLDNCPVVVALDGRAALAWLSSTPNHWVLEEMGEDRGAQLFAKTGIPPHIIGKVIWASRSWP